MNSIKTASMMFAEAAESPAVVQKQLDRNAGTVQRIGRKLRQIEPGFVLTCASPDLLSVASAARQGGAYVIALVKALHKAPRSLQTAWEADWSAAIEPMLRILSFYRMANQLSLTLGLNPDFPPYLHKVTATV